MFLLLFFVEESTDVDAETNTWITVSASVDSSPPEVLRTAARHDDDQLLGIETIVVTPGNKKQLGNVLNLSK